jgi:hypothetical protein
VQLSWIKSPFSQHDNILFDFIKKSLVDSNIYGTTPQDFSYTDKIKKYQLRLTDCYSLVNITVNDVIWVTLDGTGSTHSFDFYVAPQLGLNEIKAVSTDGTQLYASLVFKTYNIHNFLAFMGKKFKEFWNLYKQAQANIYIEPNLIQDLDGNNLEPEYKFTKSFATLLGTKRYSGLTNSQYYTFLKNVFTMNQNGGALKSYYQLQQALPDYIERVDLIPIEKYLVQGNQAYNKVYVDGTNNTKLRIYPSYVWQYQNEWGMLPSYAEAPDSTSGVFYVYTDSEIHSDTTSIGGLKIKYTDDAEFFKRESVTTDTFYSTDLRDDTSGNITGFQNGKYVVLKSPSVDGTISVDSTGSINVVSSSRILIAPNYNFVDLGTTYSTELDNVKITYKTYDIPNILAKVEKDTTTGAIINIKMSGHPAYNDSGLSYTAQIGDRHYLSYLEENYGAVVLTIRAKQKIDDELKDIINNLIRNNLPLHIKYYLVWSTIDLWDYWGQTNFTFADTTTQPQWVGVTFGDLK